MSFPDFSKYEAAINHPEGWQIGKHKNDVKGKKLDADLKGFIAEFNRMPTIEAYETLNFFATKLPEVIKEVSSRAQDLGNGVLGATKGSKEAQVTSLRERLWEIERAIGSINPRSWSAENLPRGSFLQISVPLPELSAGQKERDLTGRGVYKVLKDGSWETLSSAADIQSALIKQGASRENVGRAMSMATQDTFNSLLIPLAADKKQLNVSGYVAYFTVVDKEVRVVLEGKGTISKLATREQGTPIDLRAVYNPMTNSAATTVALYKH